MLHVLLTSLALTSGTAEAHTHHPHHTRHHRHKTEVRQVHPVVSVSWTWVNGHYVGLRWVSGYWKHPAHGVSYRAHRAGPPLESLMRMLAGFLVTGSGAESVEFGFQVAG